MTIFSSHGKVGVIGYSKTAERQKSLLPNFCNTKNKSMKKGLQTFVA